MKDHSLRPEIVFPNETSAAEDPATGRVLLAANILGLERARPKEELQRELSAKTINSAEEAARTFDLHIDGDYLDVDGQRVEVHIPVRDESTFSPEGLTLGDPQLFADYVAARAFEFIASNEGLSDRTGLTDEEIEHLRGVMAMLERSLEGDRA